MLDHIGFAVSDLDVSRAFYDAAFAPMGIKLLMEVPEAGGVLGYGREHPEFWIGPSETPLSGPVHVAFTVFDRPTVDAFYTAAMAAGGRDNGAPGLRPHYHEHYYGAFVLDPDGRNIEAVCHLPG
ncbi:VOC family protein [Breoghania sp. L-A4]|uniref:VOC family protein n=1 Tax=Breoghania sp. L-A4 TaxID=2304600 RepID=UPI000E3597E9|nr:VOC family protein [Breoghania sp. L-A4]AXS42366.1 VOC family protein [Breoghania sp. L-A4]